MIEIDVVSDVICPWCHIGRHRLLKALHDDPSHRVSLSWHPFQLNPDMPAEGMDRSVYLARKFGGAERANAIYADIEANAKQDGIHMNLDAVRRTPNTLDAHRLILWSTADRCQDGVVAALFEAYFHDGKDIGDRHVLVEIARGAGMDPASVERRLASDEDRESVANACNRRRLSGIHGVPTFLIDGRVLTQGAQPTSFWKQVLPELARLAELTRDGDPSGDRGHSS